MLITNPSEILQGFISVKNLKHILLALIYEQENSQEKLKWVTRFYLPKNSANKLINAKRLLLIPSTFILSIYKQ